MLPSTEMPPYADVMRVTGVAVLLLALPALAATPERIGTFQDWSAWQLAVGEAVECFAHSSPQREEGKYTQRGDVSVAVTHRPAGRVRNEVSFTAGYTFRPDSELKALVDDRVFRLFVDADMAFARDSATDATLVEAMMRGHRMTVQGTSRRGTVTTDTYSLAGFTAAYRAASRACGL